MWRDGEKQYVYVGGTGSASCLGLTEDQGREAEEKKLPLGFRQTPFLAPAIAEATEKFAGSVAGYVAQFLRENAEIATWGECSWTARDLTARS